MVLYHTTSYFTILYHSISYYIIISYHIILYYIIVYYILYLIVCIYIYRDRERESHYSLRFPPSSFGRSPHIHPHNKSFRKKKKTNVCTMSPHFAHHRIFLYLCFMLLDAIRSSYLYLSLCSSTLSGHPTSSSLCFPPSSFCWIPLIHSSKNN